MKFDGHFQTSHSGCGTLILGGDGLAGKALAWAFQSKAIPFYSASKSEANIVDILSLKKILENKKPSSVINCAAFTHVDEAEVRISETYEVNALGVKHIGMLAVDYGFWLCHLSTDYVFSGKKKSPYYETDSPDPIGVYGASKLEGEKYLQEICHQACIIRTSWLFGNQGKNFISLLLQLMQTKEVLQVVEDQMGKLTYVFDLAEAVIALHGRNGIYHFANNGVVNRYEIAKCLYRLVKAKGIPLLCKEIIPVLSSTFPTKAKRPLYSALATEKFESETGMIPRRWEEVLKDYV